MKNCRVLFVVVPMMIIFLSCAHQANAAMTEVNSDINTATTWTKEGSPFVVRGRVAINAPLTIEPGVVVKFLNVKTNPVTMAYLWVKADLIAVGSESEKIVFTSLLDDSNGGDTNSDGSATTASKSDWLGITLLDNFAKMTFEHVIFSYANSGIRYEAVNKGSYKNLTVKNSEIKNNKSGFTLRNVSPVIEGNVISSNENGIETFADDYLRVPMVNNNSIFENRYGINAVNPFGGARCTVVDATYNWLGDTSGPQIRASGGSTIGNPGGIGQLLYGSCIKFDPWFRRDPELKRDPIVLIPGIGASINPDVMISGIFNDNWTMFDRTYDGLIKAIKSNGYIEGKDFFVAYYDWRKSNEESAERFLKPVIDKALASNPVGKVNVIAHSMGGLVARSYVQGENYDGDINNLILIATPSKGSSDAYTVWEGGYVPKNWSSAFTMRAYLAYMSAKMLTFSNYETVHKYIPALKDLLPTYDYIHTAGGSQNLRDYLGMSEKNDFLIKLNAGIEKLKERTRFSVILGTEQETVNKIPVVESDIPGLWQDGKPFPINPEKTDLNGDGRVLLSSGDIQSSFRDILSFDHGDIVSEAEPIVMARIGEAAGEVYHAPQIEEEIGFWSESPGEMKIKDPDGKIITKDSSGVADSKFSSETKPDGFKIVSIPNPKKGQYTVTLTAPKEGKFFAGSEFVSNKEEGKDKSSTTSGTMEKDKTVELIIKIDPENIENPVGELAPRDTVSPTVTIDSPKDGEEYQDNQILPITFSVSDNVTSSEKMQIKKYLDDELLEGDTIDLSELEIGVEHNFWISANDEAGNSGNAEVFFTIRKADPPPVIEEDLPEEDDPVVETNPEPEPVALPVSVAPTQIFPTVTSVFQSVSKNTNKSSSKKHKKKKHKKKKSKKTKGYQIIKPYGLVQSVLGISSNKNVKQKSVAIKPLNQTTQKTNFISKTTKTLKDLFSKPFKYFKR